MNSPWSWGRVDDVFIPEMGKGIGVNGRQDVHRFLLPHWHDAGHGARVAEGYDVTG